MPLMNTLSSAELTDMQNMAYAATCDKACTVKRTTRTPNSSGGASVTWSEVTQPQSNLMAGMAEPTAGQLQNFDYLIGSKAAWQVKLPVWANVLELDRLTIAGETLELVKVLEPRSLAVLLTVLAVEVK